MFRLLLKILIAYWIAAAIVIFITDFEPHRQIHHPELTDALNSSLALNGRILADAFEGKYCTQAEKSMTLPGESLALVSTDGAMLCGPPDLPGLPKLVASAVRNKQRITNNYSTFQMIALPIASTTGGKYVVVLKTKYASAAEFYGLMPGYTTIIISFVVTFVLAVLVAFPIRRLRTAARAIAMGNLETRVHWGPVLERVFGRKNQDDVARLVRDFNHMAERLQAITESQRLLLRDVSHELRSPLTRLGMGLGLARREATESKMTEHLDRIEIEAKRLNELIGQILSLSYLETIQEMQPSANVSLREIVRELLPAMEYEASQSGSAVKAAKLDDCGVVGDGELLRSAIENILRNAIRYVPYGGAVQVETLVAEREGEARSIVRICDDGPGIPEEELSSVLVPFYRGKDSKQWQQGGFGIGLAIAQRAAVAHGGSIHLENRAEGGLMVEMRFPCPA